MADERNPAGPSGSPKLKAEELDRLIRSTIDGLGNLGADELPHRLRAKLKSQVGSDVDLDAIIARALRQRR